MAGTPGLGNSSVSGAVSGVGTGTAGTVGTGFGPQGTVSGVDAATTDAGVEAAMQGMEGENAAATNAAPSIGETNADVGDTAVSDAIGEAGSPPAAMPRR